MCSGPLRSGESSTRTRTSQMACGTRKSAFPSPIRRQMWLTGSLLGWLERMVTCQQMRWKCWVGNIRAVWFFMALESTGKVTPMNAKQQNAAKIGTSRHAAQQIYCHIFVFRTLKGFIIIKVTIFQLMYYPVTRLLTFSPVILLWTAFLWKVRIQASQSGQLMFVFSWLSPSRPDVRLNLLLLRQPRLSCYT